VDIGEVQRQAWQNKLAKGFSTADVALEFGLLTAEVSEAFTAWRRRQPDLGAELADVLIYLTCLAEMTGMDLSAEVERKLATHAAREYRRDGSGVLRRVEDATPVAD
jgi:NTP pyrophosphatase (non-canonical NTP hydrolase)